ncbi:hypothetical protein AVEN_249463-1 [Araneus ventricosus]|uniref:Mos1 transposase HTH domain-containing protein n=1 Tax=Araneus ventricosus TaxID=182803 RepID=A0A4Y2L1F9_ARAVE|nr:hypothetical protein AVEN_249463-1 [Araneus ventricosus]
MDLSANIAGLSMTYYSSCARGPTDKLKSVQSEIKARAQICVVDDGEQFEHKKIKKPESLAPLLGEVDLRRSFRTRVSAKMSKYMECWGADKPFANISESTLAKNIRLTTIADPADCEVRSVIRFLNAKKVKPAELHRQLVEIYGENVMTDRMVRKWVRQFNDGRTNVHDGARSGRSSVVNDGLVAKVNEKIRENRRFTIRMLFDEFPEISKTVLHAIVTNRLNYRKLCSRWVPKILTDFHKTK